MQEMRGLSEHAHCGEVAEGLTVQKTYGVEVGIEEWWTVGKSYGVVVVVIEKEWVETSGLSGRCPEAPSLLDERHL